LPDTFDINPDFSSSPHDEIVSNDRFRRSPHDEIVANTSCRSSPHDEIVFNTSLRSSTHEGIVSERLLRHSPHDGIVFDALLRQSPHDETICNCLRARFRHVFVFFEYILPRTMRDMDNPRDDTTKEQYRSRGVFTIAGVRADPETAGIEAGAMVHLSREQVPFHEDIC
jgi:hypothetical protein